MCRNRHSFHTAGASRWIVYLILVVAWLVFCAMPAWAHKVMIFAWVEGDTVYTQSKFSGGKKVRNSTVVVYDKQRNQLLEGKTDERGEFSFKVPRKTDLKIVLKASMGHMAEWTIPAKEIAAVDDKAKGNASEIGVGVATKDAALSTDTERSMELPGVTAVGLNRQQVKALIDASLDRKLAPIQKMLTDSLDHGPTVTEVIGGIGYIFGLVGVAMYFSSRRKKG